MSACVQRADDKGRIKLGRLFARQAYMVIEDSQDTVRVVLINDRTIRAQAEKKADQLVSKVQTEMTLAGHPMDQDTLDKLRRESLLKLRDSSPQLLWEA